MNYVAIIGDIKNSKNVSNRRALQEKLNSVLDSVNTVYETDIKAKFLITLGDEFQGLLNNPCNLFKIIRTIKIGMYPTEVRFGLGVGTITTAINKNAAIGADGPAFYTARNSIEEIRRQESRTKKNAQDICVNFNENQDIGVINLLLKLLKQLECNWNTQQWQTIMHLLENRENQMEYAEKIGVSQSTVSRRLFTGNFNLYSETENTIIHLINKVFFDKGGNCKTGFCKGKFRTYEGSFERQFLKGEK